MSAEQAGKIGGLSRRLEPGMRLGSYELVRRIASGGMATVWAARQCEGRERGRVVALKMVLPELSEPDFEAMFREEARLAARIDTRMSASCSSSSSRTSCWLWPWNGSTGPT